MEQNGWTFQQAVRALCGEEIQKSVPKQTYTPAKQIPEHKEKMILPKANSDAHRAFAYLVKTRHIDSQIVSQLMREHKIYENDKHSCVFVGYDKNGQEISRQTLMTANEETVLHIRPEQKTVKAGRLLFIPLQYGDSAGNWKPMEKHHLKVTVENATLEGLGSACSYVEGNYAQDTVDTYYGEAMAVVRAGEAGSVKITVSDEERTYTCEIPVIVAK